jgi:molybdopterin/thiamine biosynthesis adenylyltransferase
MEIAVISEPEDRYSRLRLVGWQTSVLRSARVLVAGAGALGNEVIKNLSLLGVGSILIADFDTIEITNLSRSVLFRETDLGCRKAEVAAVRALELNPDLDVAWFHGDVGFDLGTGVIRRCDLAIGCLDNRAARLAINRHCWLANKPWVDGALDGLDGLARVFVPSQGPCYECTLTEADYADLRRRYSCQGVPRRWVEEGLIPTTPTGASLVAALQVELAVRLLHKMEVPIGCELVYSSALSELARVKLREKEWCLSHEVAEPLIELGWARAAETTIGQLLAEAQRILGPGATLDLDREIVTHLVCDECVTIEERVVPAHWLTEQDVNCPRCAQERTLISVHRIDSDASFLDARLGDLGVPPGHIIRARENGTYCYLELSGDFPAALEPGVVAKLTRGKETLDDPVDTARSAAG